MLYFPQTQAFLSFSSILLQAIQQDHGFLVPELEHSAIQAQDIVDPIVMLDTQGYRREDRGEVAFFGKPNKIIIEVVPNTTPRHVGFIFKDPQHLQQFMYLLRKSNQWTPLDSSLLADSESIKWFMFQSELTGDHFQIIWRKNPLFVWN